MNGPSAFHALLASLVLCGVQPILASQPADAPLHLKVPPGFTIELVAGSPMTERPIVASFDEQGRLYVAESSGSNDKVEKQLEERPHRVVRLEDSNGDGKYDKRTVFADRMMFPEGAQFLDGSLYVSAPPSIWKLTDTNDDGVADERVEWFQGKTLTGCANDLHGPYLGPDGWLYWCKGAFAEQTHMVNGREWKTNAAHIFRSRTDGGGFEPVMTGGMDNPVDVVFTPEGERIFSATLVVGKGRRDGIAHAVYGGVYGKEHGVLDGHPRTGELMPVFALMRPTAPCGLERYDSHVFGEEFRDNLFACQFNMRKVSRHVLRPDGSTFATADADFVTSDNVDFHPTDVLMDADGSLLVIDTGGWYKLCCPTSQLWKPDVLGGVYRVRREGADAPVDPRGLTIKWRSLEVDELWALHCDIRPAVRQRAGREIVRRVDANEWRKFVAGLNRQDAVAAVTKRPRAGDSELCDERTAALARLWTLVQMGDDESRSCVRQLLKHPHAPLRLAALNAVSLHRDAAAYSRVVELLKGDVPANRRAAAEVLGRLGDASAVPHLLAAASSANDRVLQHSITYALIELADADATRKGLASKAPGTRAAALVALDQMPGGQVESRLVIPLLSSSDEALRKTAYWLVARHTEWGGDLSEWFRTQLVQLPEVPASPAETVPAGDFETMLADFAEHPAIQQLLAESLTNGSFTTNARRVLLGAMAKAKLAQAPSIWREALAELIDTGDKRLIPPAVAAARHLPEVVSPDDRLNLSLAAVADSTSFPHEVRVAALSIVAGLNAATAPQFELLIQGLSVEQPVATRSAACDALAKAPLTLAQLEQLCDSIASASPLELNRLVEPYAKLADDSLGMKLLSSLRSASALPSLRIDVLRSSLGKYGPQVQQGIDELESQVNVDAATQRARIETLLPRMAQGDARRGHSVYYSSKAACSACHRLGYAGGVVGPELTRIGEIRTERDLLESILYPSMSFVRSYEPVQVVTVDGRTINGAIVDETEKEYILATGPDQEVRLARDQVEQIDPSTVSVMPGGLDGQLTPEELADLVAFLKHATGK
jgi:putative membrane-bound dehydrogenase-like protein